MVLKLIFFIFIGQYQNTPEEFLDENGKFVVQDFACTLLLLNFAWFTTAISEQDISLEQFNKIIFYNFSGEIWCLWLFIFIYVYKMT